MDGTVNRHRHNAITWPTQNPHVYIQKANQKKAGVMVWIGLIKDHIIGPFFFNWSITGDSYRNLLQTQVLPTIRTAIDNEEGFVIFQQDGASAHYSKKVRDWLDRWMGRAGPIPWPARSLDLTPLEFWLWGISKGPCLWPTTIHPAAIKECYPR